MHHRPTPLARSPRSPRPAATRLAAGATGLLLGLGALVGCSGDDDAAAADPASGADLEQAQADSGVPEECREAFPVAMGPADLADLTMVPADWPQAPDGATLCQTSATPDGSVEVAEFATTAPATEVLDALEGSMPAGYAVERGDQGLGEQLTGSAGAVFFEVTTRDGAFTVTLSQ